MGLNKYRSFKDRYIDDGQEHLEIVDKELSPDFFSRNTIQVWDISSTEAASIKKWTGVTLRDRTVHEISIVNNSGSKKKVTFDVNYHLIDEAFEDELSIEIGPNGTAYFYCTAVLDNNNLVFSMRTGSQDDRKL